MAYEGIVGKLGKDIFEGLGKGTSGAATYAGIGAGVGGVAGAFLGDDTTSGALQGAVFGAALGAGTNLLPKFVKNTLGKHNIQSLNYSLVENFSDAASSYASLLSTVGDKANKQLVQDFGASARKNFFKSDRVFSRNVVQDVNSYIDKDPRSIVKIARIGEDTWDGTESFLGKKTGQDIFKKGLNNLDIWNSLETKEKYKVGTAKVLQSGFDSVYSHIIKPTGEFFSKGNKSTFENGSAAAMTGLGLYEGYNAVDNASNGNYSGAFANLAGFAGAKIAYSQAMNVRSMNKILEQKNLTWGQVGKATVAGFGSSRFVRGATKWTDADRDILQKSSSNALKALEDATLSGELSSTFVVGPHMKAAGQVLQKRATDSSKKNATNLHMMSERLTQEMSKNVSRKQEDYLKEMTHSSLLDVANTKMSNHLIGSALVFGATGMAMGGVSSDSSMLEGLLYGSATGAAKGAISKGIINNYAKGAVKNNTAELVDGKYSLKLNTEFNKSHFSSKNFFGG